MSNQQKLAAANARIAALEEQNERLRKERDDLKSGFGFCKDIAARLNAKPQGGDIGRLGDSFTYRKGDDGGWQILTEIGTIFLRTHGFVTEKEIAEATARLNAKPQYSREDAEKMLAVVYDSGAIEGGDERTFLNVFAPKVLAALKGNDHKPTEKETRND
jgi:hypothetical protein